MGIETIIGLVFSKLGGILAAVAGVLFLVWRKNAATKRANKAEAALAGAQLTQEATQETAAVKQEVTNEQAEIDHALQEADLVDLRDRFNRGDPPRGGVR